MAVLALDGIVKTYPPDLRVLDGLDLRCEAGQTLAIHGASGTGKSTLLNIVGLLDRPDAGRMTFLDQDLTDLAPAARTALRARHLGFVFQGFHLLPEFSVLENILMPARCARHPLGPARIRARELMQAVGLPPREGAAVQTLSGGERQRVALCRALLLRPRLLLADEPTGNLDPATAQVVVDQLVALTREHGSSLLMVTHDRAIAAHADRRMELRDGAVHPLD
ncbi:MAG: ABC transporter ATP-binding protein [Planctomycetota bacterium]